MKFVLTCKEFEQKAIKFIQEFYNHSSDINGSGSLYRFIKESIYANRLAKITRDLDI